MSFRSFIQASASISRVISCAALLVGASALFACGGEADLGGGCDTRGSVDECVEGGICDADDSGTPVCLEICDSQDDCSEGYECNGVSDSSTKACHPKE
jgi:hypothetical protein